jgi:hypothetical protein
VAETSRIRQLQELRPQPSERSDEFYCLARRRRLSLGKCLDDYLDANALTQRKKVCYRCPQGRANREAYAEGRPIE